MIRDFILQNFYGSHVNQRTDKAVENNCLLAVGISHLIKVTEHRRRLPKRI